MNKPDFFNYKKIIAYHAGLMCFIQNVLLTILNIVLKLTLIGFNTIFSIRGE